MKCDFTQSRIFLCNFAKIAKNICAYKKKLLPLHEIWSKGKF